MWESSFNVGMITEIFIIYYLKDSTLSKDRILVSEKEEGNKKRKYVFGQTAPRAITVSEGIRHRSWRYCISANSESL